MKFEQILDKKQKKLYEFSESHINKVCKRINELEQKFKHEMNLVT